MNDLLLQYIDDDLILKLGRLIIMFCENIVGFSAILTKLQPHAKVERDFFCYLDFRFRETCFYFEFAYLQMNAYEEIDGKKYAKKLWYEYNFFCSEVLLKVFFYFYRIKIKKISVVKIIVKIHENQKTEIIKLLQIALSLI